MRYYLDQEFIEGFHKPLFGKRRHFIDLISIALRAEDGREYHAISSEYKYSDASNWVKDNVIGPLYRSVVFGDARNSEDVHNFHKALGKPVKQIAQEIYKFINPGMGPAYDPFPLDKEYRIAHNTKVNSDYLGGPYEVAQPTIYGYFADYDWVLFCSHWGTMMDLPEGFPMYCIDLKQMFDAAVIANARRFNKTTEEVSEYLIARSDYPVNENEHLAKYDARWNENLHKFLLKL